MWQEECTLHKPGESKFMEQVYGAEEEEEEETQQVEGRQAQAVQVMGAKGRGV